MPSECYTARYPTIQQERFALDEVRAALRSEDWPRACKAIGTISEMVALARYAQSQQRKPNNIQSAIDFIMNNKAIPRPLGHKMHLIRELRNISSHPDDPNRLPYTITGGDARICEQTLMDLISWMHGDKLRESWENVVKMFDSSETLLTSQQYRNIEEDMHLSTLMFAVAQLQYSLHQAVDIKLYSLDIVCTQTDLFSKIEQLVKAGIDVRCLAWADLVGMRSYDTHGRQLRAVEADLEHLRHNLTELREVLFKLQPTFGPVASQGELRGMGGEQPTM